MIVYVETNFFLELAFMQEQHESCEQILSVCESGRAQLVVPAFCFLEAYEKLDRNDITRRDFAEKLKLELNQLRRSVAHRSKAETFQQVSDLLIINSENEKRMFSEVRQRILNAAEVISWSKDVILAVTPTQLSRTDAVVFASILHHHTITTPAKSCFISRDQHFKIQML
jgi:predicted nucleic acid-binding protein